MPIPRFIVALREKIRHDLLLLPSVSAVITNEAGHVLLQQAAEDRQWYVIGGVVEPGEEPADAVVREVLEETGLEVVPTRITGVYASPAVQYRNGDRAQFIATVFRCAIAGGTLGVSDDESLAVRFFSVDRLPEGLRADHRRRIEDALTGEGGARFVPPRGAGKR